MLKNGHPECAALFCTVFDVVNEVGGDIRDASTKHRISEAFNEWNCFCAVRGSGNDEIHAWREFPPEPGQNDQAVALLDTGITGSDRDTPCRRPCCLSKFLRD